MNVAEIITSRILADMEKTGIAVWRRPWRLLALRNAVSRKPYRGVNVLLLSGLPDSWFATFKQIAEVGGTVKKGEKANPIVFWKITPEQKDGNGVVIRDKSFILRYYNVFGLSQTEGCEFKLPQDEKLDFQPIERAEALIAASGVKINYGGNRAFYSPGLHEITMPTKETFSSIEAYYATLFHELTHWTRQPISSEKIDWTGFGSDEYSKEELTAEVGANFLLSYCGIDASRTYDNSIAYLNNWSEKLGREPRLIINASNAAQRRFDYLVGKLEPQMNGDSEPANGNYSE